MAGSTWETLHPCPVCEKAGWCRGSPDGAIVACRRVRSKKVKQYSDGSEAWLHYIDEPDPSKRGGDADARPKPLTPEAADLRDRVYTALLELLALSDLHRDNLRARGLTDEQIDRAQYRSLPYSTVDFRVQRLADMFDDDDLVRIPGLTRKKDRLALTHDAGMLVPVRDTAGQVVALKVRRDHDEPKYVYLSAGDPPSGSHLHTPWLAPTPDDTVVRITEGELKADIATVHSGILTLSVPGVMSWRLALPAVELLQPSTVLVAFDADKADNEYVSSAERSLVAALLEAGHRVFIEEWDGEHKGIDDAIIAEAAITRVEQLPADHIEVDDGLPVSTQLVELARRHFTLGVTTRSTCFAVPKRGPQWARAFSTGSDGELQDELAGMYYGATGKTANAAAIVDAMRVLRYEARRTRQTEGAQDPPLRVAAHDGKLVLDIGDASGTAVVVAPREWSVVPRSPVLFRRTNITDALPVPERGGSLDELRAILNVDDASWPLVIGWLVACLFPGISHTVGLLQGPQGSAKTTAGTMLTMLVDPTAAPSRAQPETETDWAAIGRSAYVVTLDNVSRIPAWFSDALCRASTGDAYTPRAYYQQEDVTVLSFRLAVLMTSIDAGSMRGDLADRLLPITLVPIDESRRRSEAEVWAKFHDARPRVLGALLDLTAQVLAAMPNVHLTEMPRMADFAHILAAVDEVASMNAYETYMTSRIDVAATVVEGDPIAMFIRDLVIDDNGEQKDGGQWEGTAGEMLQLLRRRADVGELEHSSVPKSERGISGALQRSAPALQRLGVNVINLGRHEREQAGKRVKRTRFRITTESRAASPRTEADVAEPY